MAATAQRPFVLPGEGSRRAVVRAKDRLALVVAAVGTTALLVAIASGLRSQREGLRTLPDEQRMALFSRTVDGLRQFCGESRPAPLDAHCRELASFAAEFDECQDGCRALVRPLLTPRPTR